MWHLGIDIGGTKTAVIIGTGNAEIVARLEFPTEPARGADRALERCCAETRKLAETNGCAMSDLAGVGISCGGPLDARRGLILSPPNLPGWNAVPVVKRFQEALGAPAWLQNDANACALAEWRFGAGRGARNMIFLTFGTGFGAGLILDGRLYAGTSDSAGEVGHVRLRDEGPVGYGKIGSAEGFCSGGGIAQLARRELLRRHQRGETPALAPRFEDIDRVTAKDIGVAAAAGDAVAQSILETSGHALGSVLAILIDVFNPERIVIGGVYARVEQFLLPAAREVLERECLPQTLGVCTIVPAGLGERIGDVAALCIALSGAGAMPAE